MSRQTEYRGEPLPRRDGPRPARFSGRHPIEHIRIPLGTPYRSHARSLGQAVRRQGHLRAIRSFKCDDTRKVHERQRVARFVNFERIAQRKLAQIDSASETDDLKIPPGNRLEALKGRRRDQWSIRINAQWRLCFRFKDGDAFDVEIVGYH